MKCPDPNLLRELYVHEGQATTNIGGRFGVSPTTVCKWLRCHNITVRTSGCNTLSQRGIIPPTKEKLYDLVHRQHKSYAEIASLYSVDFTCIPHWLRKHNIELPTSWDTRYRGNRPSIPSSDDVLPLYLNQLLSLTAIAAVFSCNRDQIKDILQQSGIEIRPAGFQGKHCIGLDGHCVRSAYEARVCDWLSTRSIAHEYEPECPFDARCKADFFVGDTYIEVWGFPPGDSSTYDARKLRKQRLYTQHGLSLMEIESWDFHNNGKWQRKLETVTRQHPPSAPGIL